MANYHNDVTFFIMLYEGYGRIFSQFVFSLNID